MKAKPACKINTSGSAAVVWPRQRMRRAALIPLAAMESVAVSAADGATIQDSNATAVTPMASMSKRSNGAGNSFWRF